MPEPAPRKLFLELFINLPVRDLAASKRFFTRLGFEFDARFTDSLAACMVVSESARVMLLSEHFFRRFAAKPRCDTATAADRSSENSTPSNPTSSRSTFTTLGEKTAGVDPSMRS